MPATKTIFIAFAKEDEKLRNLFTGQRTHSGTPFEYVDMSVKEPYASEWRRKVSARIARSDGVIVLVSSSTPSANGQLWEIGEASNQAKPMLGVWVEEGYRTKPEEMNGAPCQAWTWPNIGNFIDSL